MTFTLPHAGCAGVLDILNGTMGPAVGKGRGIASVTGSCRRSGCWGPRHLVGTVETGIAGGFLRLLVQGSNNEMLLESIHGLLSIRFDAPIVASQLKETGVEDKIVANADD